MRRSLKSLAGAGFRFLTSLSNRIENIGTIENLLKFSD